ncbi:MAG: hypothetical protein QF519_06005 [Candidatus Poseidoniia archaeon]|jgi:hypothetical protein|nr:hypothetical protein [Candidatus Poseidoniia archaeon]
MAKDAPQPVAVEAIPARIERAYLKELRALVKTQRNLEISTRRMENSLSWLALMAKIAFVFLIFLYIMLSFAWMALTTS